MAPTGDAAAAQAPAPKKQSAKSRRISIEGLQRAMSDLALELARDSKKQAATPADADADAAKLQQLPAIAEQQQQQQQTAEEEEEELARCECCGMQEVCTPQYVRRVRDRYCGRWVCGLCAAAVSAEAEGGRATTEAALAAHMAVCGRFNRVGRANPVLLQTEAMRQILRKRGARCDSPRVRDRGARPAAAAALARSSSCIPAITKDFN
ncbi:uncharacterized protein [Zea mays]|uniref:DUF1677 family protein n=1 Tax=Zea mays TaxID=4577 RepID=A0A1D6MGW1_MAIZE|nr:uncharacterized protein LOC103649609 [Zea mays]ONM28706.1 hypothetical protein ZEAMMB73_Zm00001d039420 [Zea mays]|eukprot:XP_008673568.1 uncharacterized protein LOC103649609 [Zea mays]